MPIGSPPRSPTGSTSISAPIRSRMPSSPVRVGFVPTPSSATSLPGTSSAATMKKAAEEKSVGTANSPSCQPLRPAAATTPPRSQATSAPAAESIRSV